MADENLRNLKTSSDSYMYLDLELFVFVKKFEFYLVIQSL
jgi:hypothetical protein